DAGAGLHVGDAVADHHCPQGDAGVHVAGEVDVADGAAVGSAAVRLEFVDDLHGPHFRRAAERAGRQGRPQRVEGGQILSQLAGDGARKVHDVAVALDGEQVADADAADLGDAADVVAGQI